MSDYGISVLRTAGKVQIDGNFKNFSVFDYDTKVKPGGCGFSIFLYGETNTFVLQEIPWIVFNLDDTNTGTVHSYVGPVQYVRYSAASSAYDVAQVATGQAAMDIPWMALTSPYKAREPYGLEIFTPAGESAFTSWEPYVEIVGVYDFTLDHGTASSFDITTVTVKDAVNNYFHITNSNYKWYHNWAIHAEDEIQYYTMGMAKLNNVTVEIGNGVPCWSVVWSSVPSYIVGDCWTKNSQLIELAPVRALT